MRRLAGVAMLLGALAGSAAAQEGMAPPEGGAPAGMPDPRQMSGIPRPDQKVPGGVVTVKVTRGELGRYAPQGTLVHLIAYPPDGTIKAMTAAVDAEGRAEFKGLARDGQTVYYAFTLFNDDRLESQMITLPPMVGVRMMLTGRKTDETGQPVGDPIDDAHDAEAPAVPVGEVRIFLGGQADAGVKVKLIAIGEPDAAREAEAKEAGDQLIAAFTGVPTGNDHVYIAQIDKGGQVYRSQPFQMSALAGVSKGILVTDKILFGMQGGAQVDDERMIFELSLAIANVTGAPVNPGEKGIVMPLPKGARFAKIADDDATHAAVIGDAVVWRGVIPPGQQDIVVQFAMPIKEGGVVFEMPMPYGLLQSQIAIEKAPGAIVTAEGAAAKPRTLDDGKEFMVLSDLMVKPGGRLRFEVTGLPQRSQFEHWLILIAGILVLGFISWAVVASLLPARKEAPATAAARQRELAGQRDRLYDQLVALERRHAGGGLEEEVYERERKALVTRLVVVHRELDALDAGGAATAGAKPRAPRA